ncbi:MAG: hypothetical protein ABJG28_00540, partial [Nonlabens ulvanivorans]|uniref:hypothetical protein n=1 Tax=Nonlabens ulvanivorans TaxID=906888 RepID=UPI003264E7CD
MLFKKPTNKSNDLEVEHQINDKNARPSHSVALEPRFMFDAAGAVTAIDVASNHVVDTQTNAFISEQSTVNEQAFANNEALDEPLPGAINRADDDI